MAVGVAQEPPVVVLEGEPGLPQFVFVAAAQGPVAEPLEQELRSLAWGDLSAMYNTKCRVKDLQKRHPRRQGGRWHGRCRQSGRRRKTRSDRQLTGEYHQHGCTARQELRWKACIFAGEYGQWPCRSVRAYTKHTAIDM